MSILPLPQLRNQNPPTWFISGSPSYREVAQDQADVLYLHAPTLNSVDTFEGAKKDWITNQQRARELSPDPASFVPSPFTRPLPQREVVDISDDGLMTVYSWKLDPDPNIHPPVLPPYVKPNSTPNAGFVTTAPQAAQDEAQKFAAIMANFASLHQKLDRLLAGQASGAGK